MGLLVKGEWKDEWYDTDETDGAFERDEASVRSWVEADPEAEHPAEPGRYHLYVSYACPWAHRTLIFRKLKRLDEAIGLSVVDPYMGSNGWEFASARGDEAADGATDDDLLGKDFLHQVYAEAKPDFTGRVTVPVLWDREAQTIVSNESSEIIRMLNSAFDRFGDASVDFAPEELLGEIDAVNERVYHSVNNGVYKCGFATEQAPYEKAFGELFATLDWLEERLADRRYLVGDRLTEADWRLFTTLVRFDAVYHGHFKCNLRRIVDYPNLSNYLRELYQIPGVADTVRFDHIKPHYYRSHPMVNPTRIVPVGPQLDLDRPHDRERLPGAPWRVAA
ncbi:MAG: glutathione S-transferase family protein [Acidobacteria bacterium]|nr:MAG: glutathione S-transferase family protein [Acidobacteriota bacterium]